MRDVELYKHLLGLVAPWTVAEVKLDISGQRVDVWVEHGEEIRWPCPECQALLATHDHSEERVWRHLDSCQFMTYLHARPPRINCKEHGVRQVRLPWAEPASRFTALFERLAIDVLKETSVRGACKILRVTWDEAFHIMEKAVERGLLAKEKRALPAIGIDEKAIAKGHTYFTLVSDLLRGTVEHVAEDRKEESLDGYFQSLTTEQLEAIEAVAVDMWVPYLNAIRKYVPEADDKIVFDRFHIMQHAVKAVDKVRKREHRTLREKGDETLKGTKYLWLYSGENLPGKHRERFGDLRDRNLQTGRAWAIKESLRDLWTYMKRGWAERYWKRWYGWAIRARLKPVLRLALMLKRHLRQILNYVGRYITNAGTEGLNSVIQTVKQRACGFRNKDHFKTAIFFHCGGLQLYPVTHGEV